MYIHTFLFFLWKYLLISIGIIWPYIYMFFLYFFFLNVIFHIFLSSARRWRIDKKPTSISEDVCIIARGWPLPTMPCTCERPSMGWSVQNIGFTTIEKPMRILKNKVVLWVDLVWNIKLIMEWIIYIYILLFFSDDNNCTVGVNSNCYLIILYTSTTMYSNCN